MQSEWTRPAWSGPGCRWSFRSIASGAPNLLHSIHKRGHRKSQNANEARCSDEAQLCLQSGCDKKGLELSTFRDQITAQSFRWGTMARYFFHVIGADGAFKDAEGLSFPALEDAMAYAAVIAGELSGESENYQGFAVCVADEQGREVARVPIDGDPD
jgi:hypothetical protein